MEVSKINTKRCHQPSKKHTLDSVDASLLIWREEVRGRVAPGAKATAGAARRKAVANFIVKYFFLRLWFCLQLKFSMVDDIRQIRTPRSFSPSHTFLDSSTYLILRPRGQRTYGLAYVRYKFLGRMFRNSTVVLKNILEAFLIMGFTRYMMYYIHHYWWQRCDGRHDEKKRNSIQ